MVDTVVAKRWTTAQDFFHKKKLNTIDASARTIQRMLDEVGLGAYRPTKVPFISEDNKIDFCDKNKRWTKHWQKVVFTDESWLCAEAFHLRYIRRFSEEVLSEEYTKKKIWFKGNKKLFVRAAISFDGPEKLYFIEGKENTDCYEEILNAFLSDISKLLSSEYIF